MLHKLYSTYGINIGIIMLLCVIYKCVYCREKNNTNKNEINTSTKSGTQVLSNNKPVYGNKQTRDRQTDIL